MQNQENPIVWNELEKEIIRYTTRYSSDSRFSSGSIAALIDIIIDSSNEYIENLDGILKLFMTNTNRTIHPEDIKRFVYASNQAIKDPKEILRLFMIKPILIHSDGAIHSHVIKIILDKSNKTTEEKIEILESFIITNDNAYQKESFILLQKKERDKLPKPLDEVIKNNNIKFYINPRNPHNIDKEGFFPNEEKDGPYQLKEGEKIESRLGKIINGKQKERKYVITGEKKELIVQIAHGNKLFFETLSDQSQAHGYESSDSADDNYILTDKEMKLIQKFYESYSKINEIDESMDYSAGESEITIPQDSKLYDKFNSMIHSEKVININGKDYIDITSEMTQTFKNIMNPSQTINNQYTSQLGAQSIV